MTHDCSDYTYSGVCEWCDGPRDPIEELEEGIEALREAVIEAIAPIVEPILDRLIRLDRWFRELRR